MAYHIYTTDGIILKKTAFGEANMLLHILTRDLGLIMASAQGIRLNTSKLGAHIQEYSYASLSFVKGKNGWKMTNAIEKNNFFFDCPSYARKTVAQVGSLLLKMITGESPHPEIFQTVLTGFEFLKNIADPPSRSFGKAKENISNFEILLVLRILHQLGYVSLDSSNRVFLIGNTEWNDELLKKVSESKIILVGLINKGLKESQM